MVIVLVQHGNVEFSHVTRSRKHVTDRDEALARAKATRLGFIETGYYDISLRGNIYDESTEVDSVIAIK